MAYKIKNIVSYFTVLIVSSIFILVLHNATVLSSYQPITLYDSQTTEVTEGSKHKEYTAPKLKPLDLIPRFQTQSGLLSKNIKREDTLPPLELLLDNCTDSICSELLFGEDVKRFEHCENSTIQSNGATSNNKCHFISGKYREPVALVSFPGSGNTWVRGLLEEITGVCTGAVYCDISLRGRGFVGEYLRSGSVLVVKTHGHRPIWIDGANGRRPLSAIEGRYRAAIFIVRNPFKALVADWNRNVANNFNTHTIYLDTHVKQAGKEWFGELETIYDWSLNNLLLKL